MSRIAIVLAVLAVAVAATAVVCVRRSRPAPPPVAAPVDAAVVPTPPPGPKPPDVAGPPSTGAASAAGLEATAGGTGAAPPAPSVSFEQEARDPSWAVEHERELTFRLRRVVDDLARRGVAIDVDAIECRRSQCRVAVHAKSADALGKLFSALEAPAGVYGWADNLMLAEVATAPDGQVTTTVTASFDRD